LTVQHIECSEEQEINVQRGQATSGAACVATLITKGCRLTQIWTRVVLIYGQNLGR
jgi:hypothetical protein